MTKGFRGILLLCVSVGIVLFFIGNVCPIEHIVGIPCPGCNMFSACYWLLIKGNIAIAQYYHPAVLPFLLYCGIVGIVYCFHKENFTQSRIFKISSVLFLCVFIGVYVYRMYTIFPDIPMGFNEQAFLPRLFHRF